MNSTRIARAAARRAAGLTRTGRRVLLGAFAGGSAACGGAARDDGGTAGTDTTTARVAAATAPALPAPDTTHDVQNRPTVVGWDEGRTPVAPDGFSVSLFADGLQHPRWLYVLPNGDVLVAEANKELGERDRKRPPDEIKRILASGSRGPSADRITLFRDANRDGRPEVRETFLSGLNQPFGMVLVGNTFYVAKGDALTRFPYRDGETRITAGGQKVLDLPAGGYNNHWTRNVVANRDGTKLYVSVGSGTNVDEERVDEKDPRRAAILEVNPDGSGMRVFASGLRNPNGMAWAPGTGMLWTAVNERDGLGNDLVPDYITSVRDGAFYGWPYSYFGQNVDPRKRGERPDLVARAVVPDVPVGSHTASLGLVFYDGLAFPEEYRGGAFVAQHGSWNRAEPSGYKVIHVPFVAGRPSGEPRDFLTGFVADGSADTLRVYGRPVGLAVLPDGSLLVADDADDRIWRVAPEGGSAAPAAAPRNTAPPPTP
jgi:glucose/arabinose dehydrogenase